MLYQFAVHREGDLAGLLRHDHDDRVRLLGETESRSVARAHGGAEGWVLGQRQDAFGAHNHVSLDDQRAVVQRCVRFEDRRDQRRGDLRVDADTGFDDGRDAHLPNQHDQPTVTPSGKHPCGGDDLVNHTRALRPEQKPNRPCLSQPDEHAPEFGLEEHDQSENPDGLYLPQKPRQAVQM